MTRLNYLIGIIIALLILATLLALIADVGLNALLGMGIAPQIVNGVSTPEWWGAQKVEPF